MKILRTFSLMAVGLGLASGCGFDDTLREYLDARFWLPFSKHGRHFENRKVGRVSAPFAGMRKQQDSSPLGRLRAAYQEISKPMVDTFDGTKVRAALAAARADKSLGTPQREEVDLIDAKIDMRSGQPDEPAPIQEAKKKFETFLKAARTPELLSEARGWLAYTHFLLGEQTAAGKLYLDELNRNGSNLSRETLLSSLKITYGYDGGQELIDHLDEYFDTPEHAAFAIEIATNPHWERRYLRNRQRAKPRSLKAYTRIHQLLMQHAELFKSANGSQALALLSMRTALSMGDPPGALKIPEMVPSNDTIRTEPDFQWMLASSYFLSYEYAAAERPLLDLFESPKASDDDRSAAAYALCGVYEKTGNAIEQIRFALWLKAAPPEGDNHIGSSSSQIADQSIYWASSGWDLGLLLDTEASIEALESFLDKYPQMAKIRVVKYSLAVRLARENRYEEAARIYESIHAVRRAPRMRELAELYAESKQTHEAAYRFAKFLGDHENGVYYNDAIWGRLQSYALMAPDDSRLTRQERQRLMEGERKLKDYQEERWRAAVILRDVAEAEGKTELGRKAAQLAVRCVRGLSDRFGHKEEIRKTDIEMSRLLRP